MDDGKPTVRATELQAQANLLSVLQLVGAGRLRCSATTRRPGADRLTLDAYGERTADHVWTVRADTLLAAIEGGRSPAQLLDFLGGRRPGMPL